MIFRGTEEYFNSFGKVDIINSTLGKALGGAMGGYTTSKKPLIDLLRQRSRPYLFSNSLPPSVVASGIRVSLIVAVISLKCFLSISESYIGNVHELVFAVYSVNVNLQCAM